MIKINKSLNYLNLTRKYGAQNQVDRWTIGDWGPKPGPKPDQNLVVKPLESQESSKKSI